MYRFVIGGGRPAGCVLGHRLSANPRTRTLPVEAAGTHDAAAIAVPVRRLVSAHPPFVPACSSLALAVA